MLAGVWAAAAYLLWRHAACPGDSHLAGLDVTATSSARTCSTGPTDYARFVYWLVSAHVVATIVVLRCSRLARRRASRASRRPARSAPGCSLGNARLRDVWFVPLPFGVARALVGAPPRPRAARATSRGIFGAWLVLALEFAVPLPRARDRDGARAAGSAAAGGSPAGRSSSALAACSSSSAPYLTPATSALQDRELRGRRPDRSSGARASATMPVRVAGRERPDERRRTRSRSASGRRGRVVLWDTLLDGRFTRRRGARS